MLRLMGQSAAGVRVLSDGNRWCDHNGQLPLTSAWAMAAWERGVVWGKAAAETGAGEETGAVEETGAAERGVEAAAMAAMAAA